MVTSAALPDDGARVGDDTAGALTLGERLDRSERAAARETEVAIQRCRAWCVGLGLLQSIMARGDRPWVQFLALAGVGLTWLIVRQLLQGGVSRLRVSGWVAMAGDSIGVTLVLANLLASANDPIQLLPLILVGEAAARWGRSGGFWGGVLGGALSSLWVTAVYVRNHLMLPLSFVSFRFLFFIVLGTFVGSIVQQSRTQRRSAEALFNGSRDLVASFGFDGRLRSVNPACVDILGYAPEELIGHDRAMLLAPDAGFEVPEQVDADDYRRGGARLIEVQMAHKDGRPVWMEVDLLPDLADGVIRVIGRDISARRRTEADLRRRVELDGLTGAMNRGALVERLTALLAAGSKPGLVFVDIDHFKAINDQHGHVAGDQALVELVLRLNRAAGPDDQVARYAGDEFCVVVHHPDDVDVVSGRIADALATPFSLGGAVVQVTASLGATDARPGDTSRDLIDRADQAMYRVKRNERRTGEERRRGAVRDGAITASGDAVVLPLRP
jgi:diguanylate cyclase (GGDEF)-like protein/PAS domain S-box-containing protein